MELIKLLRPHHYIKNLFVFAPIFFVGQITNPTSLTATFLAFMAFCLAASAVYVLNDLLDVDDDRNHPTKKHRPLASGAVSVKSAYILILALLCLSLAVCYLVSLKLCLVVSAYLAINICYSFGLKALALIDVCIIACGFVLRLFAGALAAEVSLTSWIVIMTFLLALFLALAKRRDDVLIFDKTGRKMRSSLDGYNLKFLDNAVSIMASIIIVTYISYVTSEEVAARINSEYLYLSAFFVIIGLLRYLQLTLVFEKSGSPTQLALRDLFIQITVVAWLLIFSLALY